MLKVANSVISASRITGVLPVVNGGTGVTTSTGTGNTVLSASPTFTGTAVFATLNGVGYNFSGSAPASSLTLDASGNFLLGTAIQLGSSNARLNVSYDGSTLPWGASFKSTANNGINLVFISASNGAVGSISHTSTTTSYNTTSDQRLKQNIQDADSASNLIDSLQVRKFNWKSNNSHQRYGFVAQELVSVAPEAVYQSTDTKEMMAVDYSKLIPMLVKEVQSLRARVSQLEKN